MSGLRDVLDGREVELNEADAKLDEEQGWLDSQQANLDERRAEIAAERAEIEVARAALRSNLRPIEVAGNGTFANEIKMTIKEMVVEILGVLPRGADALEILRLINERFNAGLARTSLSPQLSRLKQEGVLERQGMIWFLNEKGPAEAGPSLDLGGGTGREAGYPPARPEGSIPSASTPSHTNGSGLTADRSEGATPG